MVAPQAWRPNHFSATSDLRFAIAHEFFVPHGQALEKLANLTDAQADLNPPGVVGSAPYEPTGNQLGRLHVYLH